MSPLLPRDTDRNLQNDYDHFNVRIERHAAWRYVHNIIFPPSFNPATIDQTQHKRSGVSRRIHGNGSIVSEQQSTLGDQERIASSVGHKHSLFCKYLALGKGEFV
jgi:hypothetical protein